MKHFRFRIFIAAFIINLTACSPKEPLNILDVDKITKLGEDCTILYSSHIDAWNSRETSRLRSIYSKDIVHYDGMPLFVGINSVVDMARVMFSSFPDWKMSAGNTYISADKCAGEWKNWSLMGLSENNPGVEFDVLESKAGLINYWTVYYDQNFFNTFQQSNYVDVEFLNDFLETWSTGDIENILNLYSSDVEFQDTLFEYSIKGQESVSEFGQKFIVKTKNTEWQLQSSFAESPPEAYFAKKYPYQSQGGVFTIRIKDWIGNPCEIVTLIILTANEDGKIIKQENFYDAKTLVECGWAK